MSKYVYHLKDIERQQYAAARYDLRYVIRFAFGIGGVIGLAAGYIITAWLNGWLT